MPLRDRSLAVARSLILPRCPSTSDKYISTVYSLRDSPHPRIRSASNALGIVCAAFLNAFRKARSSGSKGLSSGVYIGAVRALLVSCLRLPGCVRRVWVC
ncbi:Uncharacterised protein [Mycobacteroides abscessus subsp. abscessus]|nr:Uncharacterised protein [Mycobacteroides abscessus subsp. abscessus]